MEVNTKSIPYRQGDKFTIKPMFDVHVGNRACDESAFREYLHDSDDATYFIGGGDLMDAVIASDIKRYRKSVDTSGAEIDSIVDYQIERAGAFLYPYKERILGLGSGNHEDTILSKCSTDMTKRLCDKLGVPFLGYSGIYRIKFRRSDGRNGEINGTRTLDIRYHHGWASGRTPGGQLTSNTKDVMHWDADIFLYGHGHKLLTDTVTRLGINSSGKLEARDIVVCLCGTFLKTFVSDHTTYSERKGYAPIKCGSPYITVKPMRTRTGQRFKITAHTS